MAAIALAVTGAFASQKPASSAAFADETGWINLSATQPCHQSVTCSNVSNPQACTMLYQGVTRTAFGKVNPNINECAKTLYRKL